MLVGIVGFVGFVWQEGSPVQKQHVFAGAGNAPPNPHFSRACREGVSGRFEPGFPQALSVLRRWNADC